MQQSLIILAIFHNPTSTPSRRKVKVRVKKEKERIMPLNVAGRLYVQKNIWLVKTRKLIIDLKVATNYMILNERI